MFCNAIGECNFFKIWDPLNCPVVHLLTDHSWVLKAFTRPDVRGSFLKCCVSVTLMKQGTPTACDTGCADTQWEILPQGVEKMDLPVQLPALVFTSLLQITACNADRSRDNLQSPFDVWIFLFCLKVLTFSCSSGFHRSFPQNHLETIHPSWIFSLLGFYPTTLHLSELIK